MKKTSFAIAILLFLFISCGKKSEHTHENTDSTGTHKHDDGRVHKDHEKAKTDSVAQDTTATGHGHQH
jgi:hypothetical protein